MNATNTQDFSTQLQRLLSIESMLVESMPLLLEKARTSGLKKSLALHFEETRQHKVAIEGICKQLYIDIPEPEPDEGLKKILGEGEQNFGNRMGDDLDIAIIEMALQVEQYEMESYPPVADAAEEAGFEGIASRLRLTLAEEIQAETKLRFLKKSLSAERAEIGQV